MKHQTHSKAKGLHPAISLMFILSVACSSIHKTTYTGKGMIFQVTPAFRIGRSDTTRKNQATYVPIYCREDVYAKFSVIWVPCLSDLDHELQIYVDGMTSIYANDPVNKPVYSEVRTTKFGNNEARQIDYSVLNDGQRVGSYTVFHCDGFTVIVGQHNSLEGQALANKCRDVIEATYARVN